MLTILHGDDEVKVHAALLTEIESAKRLGVEVVRLNAKGITMTDLENAVATQELFAPEKLVIIDGLLSLPKSKSKEELLSWIEERGQRSDTTLSLVLVENKLATAAQLKPFGSAKVVACKVPMILFQFVESIGLLKPAQAVTRFHEVLEHQEAEFVFAMLIRQIRTLLAFVADGAYDGPPFGRQKVERQARAFTKEKLLILHAALLEIDIRQKTSRSAFTLAQEIDLWLTQL